MTIAGRLRKVVPVRRAPGSWTVRVAAGLFLLGGCASLPQEPPLEIESSRTYERQSRAAVFERTLAALEAGGLQVVRADEDRGMITAVERGFQDRGWAECVQRRVTARDDTRRIRRARPLDREVELTAAIRETAEGVTLTLDSAFSERQLNTLTNLDFSQSCRSTGALERQLFEAVEQRLSAARPPA